MYSEDNKEETNNMFICDSCLKENFTNGESMFKSRGRCEMCEESATCNEIQSSRLVLKTPLRPNVDDTLKHYTRK